MDLTCVEEVVGILQEVVHLLKQPGTDVVRSRYNSGKEAVEDIIRHIERLRRGDPSRIEELVLLFAPTGSVQEISISSDWGEGLLNLTARFDRAIESVPRR